MDDFTQYVLAINTVSLLTPHMHKQEERRSKAHWLCGRIDPLKRCSSHEHQVNAADRLNKRA